MTVEEKAAASIQSLIESLAPTNISNNAIQYLYQAKWAIQEKK